MERRETIYHVRRLGVHHWRIGNSAVHMDLIVGSHHALLFDTGYGFGDLCGLVRGITDLPLYVVISHGHVDHACGNWQFDRVYIHPEDLELCREHNGPELRMAELDTAEVPLDFDLEDYLSKDCGTMIPVGEGDVFDLGGVTLRVVHFPGHTMGSIGLYCEELRLLFAGDAMNCFVWLFLPEAAPLSTYLTSLKKAEALDFDFMIQSHEPDPVPKAKLSHYIDLAEHLDFEAGLPVPAPPGANVETRICTRLGIHHDDRENPGHAAILISRDKL